MPIYEFHCKNCGKEVELLVRSSASKDARCPECGSERMMKRLSVFAAPAQAAAPGNVPSCSGNPTSCPRCVGE